MYTAQNNFTKYRMECQLPSQSDCQSKYPMLRVFSIADGYCEK